MHTGHNWNLSPVLSDPWRPLQRQDERRLLEDGDCVQSWPWKPCVLKKHLLLLNSNIYKHKATTPISNISLAGQLVSPLSSSSQTQHSAEVWVNGTCHHGGFRNTESVAHLETLCFLVITPSVNFPFHRLVNPESSYRPQLAMTEKSQISPCLQCLSVLYPARLLCTAQSTGKEKNSKWRGKQPESYWKWQEDKWVASNLRVSLVHLSLTPLFLSSYLQGECESHRRWPHLGCQSLMRSF